MKKNGNAIKKQYMLRSCYKPPWKEVFLWGFWCWWWWLARVHDFFCVWLIFWAVLCFRSWFSFSISHTNSTTIIIIIMIFFLLFSPNHSYHPQKKINFLSDELSFISHNNYNLFLIPSYFLMLFFVLQQQ